MSSIVIFSVTVMAMFVDVLDNLLGNQERLGGGYEVVGFVGPDLNPVGDLRAAVDANPDLASIERVDGVPSGGTFHTIFQADARLASDSSGEFVDTTVTGVGDDFFAKNRFGIALPSDQFTLNDVEGLLVENDNLEPVKVTVLDLESGNTFWLATPPRL